MDDLIILVLAVFIAVSTLILAGYQYIRAAQERQQLINRFVERLIAKDQDMLDRLMAKDLPEAKEAQRDGPRGRVTSKRQNEARIIKQRQKIAEGKPNIDISQER